MGCRKTASDARPYQAGDLYQTTGNILTTEDEIGQGELVQWTNSETVREGRWPSSALDKQKWRAGLQRNDDERMINGKFPSICLFYPSVYPSANLSVRLSVYLSLHLPVRPSVRLSVPPPTNNNDNPTTPKLSSCTFTVTLIIVNSITLLTLPLSNP